MARVKATVTATERGKALARVTKEYKNRVMKASGNDEVTSIEIPWYARFLDSYHEEMIEIAKEVNA